MVRGMRPRAFPWLLALLALAPASCSGGEAPERAACDRPPARGDARDNSPEDPRKPGTYDAIELPGDAGALFVVYSGREADDGRAPCPVPEGSPANTAGIFVLPLADEGARHQALVFGAGYGDWCLASDGATCDARRTAHVLREELGMRAGSTDVRFVAPHGHMDHVNPEFLAALEAQGYRVRDIVYHAADEGLAVPAGVPVEAMAWSAAQRARLRAVESVDEIHDGPGGFASPLGAVRFLHRPEHTPGSLDLVLEGAWGALVVRGSLHAGHEPGYLLDLKAHGNALWTEPGER